MTPPPARSRSKVVATGGFDPAVISSPAIVIVGAEDLLADRAVAAVLADARLSQPDLERREVDLGSESALGNLVEALSPNLFGDAAVVVCRGLESADVAIIDLILSSVSGGLEGVRLVAVHPGGAKGRQHAERLRKAGLGYIAVDKTKGRGVDDFIAAEFARLERTATDEAIASLRTALGDDLRSLAAACSQLSSDVESGPIDGPAVAIYYDGVADVPGYLISDAVWDGRTTEVLRRTRWALTNDSGIGPAVTAAVAGGLRQLVKYGAVPRGMSEGEMAAFVGAPPFKLRSLREQAGRWHPAALARAVGAIAVADAAVKGRDASGRVLDEAGLDREQGAFLLEQALLDVVRTRSGNS